MSRPCKVEVGGNVIVYLKIFEEAKGICCSSILISRTIVVDVDLVGVVKMLCTLEVKKEIRRNL